MQSLKSLDELNKPDAGPSNPTPVGSPMVNKRNPEFMKPEKLGPTILAASKLRSSGGIPKLGGTKKEAPDAARENRLSKLWKIKRYLEKFPELRQTISLPGANASDAELDQCLFDIHRHLNGRRSEAIVPIAVDGLFKGIEVIVMDKGYNPMNLDLTGLKGVASNPKNNQNLMSIATEIYIEYEHYFSMGPMSRFATEVIGFVLTVDAYNKARKVRVPEEEIRKMDETLDPDDNSKQ